MRNEVLETVLESEVDCCLALGTKMVLSANMPEALVISHKAAACDSEGAINLCPPAKMLGSELLERHWELEGVSKQA